MALSIRFNNSERVLEVFCPLTENMRSLVKSHVTSKNIHAIVADGHEGVACINAYRRMQGEPPMEAEAIGYQVCYTGDIAASVLLNIVYSQP